MSKVFLSFLFIFTFFCGLIQATEYTWTGNGTNGYVSTKENWSGNTQCFSKNSFGLMHQASNGNTYIIPEGASAITTGFDLDNSTVIINGSCVSKRESYNGFFFNGFWLRNGNTITIGKAANFTCTNGTATDKVQLTMCGSNNTLNKYDSGTLNFANMFISTYDCGGGNHNVVNQYAGTVTAEQVNLGTKSNFADANKSYYNLYAGTVETQQTHLNTFVNSGTTYYGRGELNIYGGSYTTETLTGGTSVNGSNSYRSDINVHVGPDGYGAFTVTGTNTYTGVINVVTDSDSAIQSLSADLASTPLVSLSALSGNETININTPLFKLDGTDVVLDTSKNLGSGLYSVNTPLTFGATQTGYLEMAPVGNPFKIEMTVSGFESQDDANLFAKWLSEDSGIEAQMTTPTSLVLNGFPASATNQLLFLDFSHYTQATVQATGLMAAELPEPATWVLLLVGLFGSAVIRRASAFTAFISGKTAR